MSIKEIVRQDDTWMALDPIIGCAKDCQYCFLQTYGMTPRNSEVIATPEESIQKLTSFLTYHPDSIVMLGSETDVFMNKKNIDYYTNFIEVWSQAKVGNTLALVTKSKIPEEFIDFAKNIDTKILFYISYSGLQKPIEPATNIKHLQENFINLKNASLPVIHYWRPFLPQNSTPKIINQVLQDVTPYADCSMVSGLKVNDGIIDNLKTYWPELERFKGITDQIGSVWPTGVRQYLKQVTSEQYPDYPIFWTNSCAASSVLQQPDFNAFLGTHYCETSNCPPLQRTRCVNIDQVIKRPNKSVLVESLKHLGLGINYEIVGNTVHLNTSLDHAQTVYLRQRLNSPVIARDYRSRNEWAGFVLQRPDLEI